MANLELVPGSINCVRIGSRKKNFPVYNYSNWFPNKITYQFISLVGQIFQPLQNEQLTVANRFMEN